MKHQRFFVLRILIVCLLFPIGAAAQLKRTTTWDFVPGDAVGVASVRWSALWRHEVMQEFRKTLPRETKEGKRSLHRESKDSRSLSAKNLHKLALAAHDFHSVYKRFPAAAVYDKNGKPLLSWRVLLLPYLGEDKLYRKFRLDEPWNSPHNKKLLVHMPKVFAMPVGEHAPSVTYYQAVISKGTVFESRRGLSLLKIVNADGTSNTILFVEAKNGVPWTKPADVKYILGKKPPPLGGHFPGGFHAVLCDGATYFLSSKLRSATLRSLFSWNDGMRLPPKVFER